MHTVDYPAPSSAQTHDCVLGTKCHIHIRTSQDHMDVFFFSSTAHVVEEHGLIQASVEEKEAVRFKAFRRTFYVQRSSKALCKHPLIYVIKDCPLNDNEIRQ